MGLKGQADHPDVAAVIEAVEDAILPSPVILGGVATTPERVNTMVERGYRTLVIGFDWSLLHRGIESVLNGIRP